MTAVDGQPVPTPAEFYRLAGDKASVTLRRRRGSAASPRRKKVTLP